MAEQFKGACFPEWYFVPRQFTSAEFRQIRILVRQTRRMIRLVPIPRGDIANAGNLSCRTAAGCMITRTGCSLRYLHRDDVIEVVGWDQAHWVPTASGPAPNEPSSETGAHIALYRARPDANVIVHLHSHDFVAWHRSIEAVLTDKEFPYGTPQFVAEILKVIGNHDLVCLRGPEHVGFFALGRDWNHMNQIIQSALAKIAKAKRTVGRPSCMTC